MESILYQLYNGDYDITPQWGKAQQEIRNQIFRELDKVAAAFGADFLDHLFDLYGDWSSWENYQYYRTGFILGVQLMLEVMQS